MKTPKKRNKAATRAGHSWRQKHPETFMKHSFISCLDDRTKNPKANEDHGENDPGNDAGTPWQASDASLQASVTSRLAPGNEASTAGPCNARRYWLAPVQ